MLGIATNIISAVSKPFIAKISDITSRPYTYILVVGFYVVGYIVAATSQTIAAYGSISHLPTARQFATDNTSQ